jgi:hypothetical protein
MDKLEPPETSRSAGTGCNCRRNASAGRERVDGLMPSVHAVPVPSIWWENPPVVIQHALRNSRPAIGSDIGGMAEKVRGRNDRLHVPAGNAMTPPSLLCGPAENRGVPTDVSASMSVRAAPEASLGDHIEVYRQVVVAPRGTQ